MAATVRIEIVTGTPRLHLWCDRCMTSAGWEVGVYCLSDDGPRELGKVRRCARCDQTE